MDNRLIGVIVAILLTLAIAAGIYLYTDYQTDKQTQIWQKQSEIQNFTH